MAMAVVNKSSTQTEEYLTEVSEELTYITGEEGLSRKVVDDMRDFFRLDDIERIRSATSIEFVLSEMRPYLNDSAVCFVGIQSILNIMERFASTTDIIRKGFQTLRIIVHNHEDNADILVMKLQGIQFLAERMKEFQTDADAMENACWMMWDLCHFTQLRKPIADSRALGAIAFAYDRHHGNLGIQEPARQAIVLLLNELAG
jgi:hypothetical protein